MARCLISFGANIGNPLETIQQAAELLRRRLVDSPAGFRISRYFRTPPVGGPAGQPPFINAVAALDTRQTALEVWNSIRDVEAELGRVRNLRWEARRIDLDILLYENERHWTSQLKIPHPRMCMRRFILLPAMDVAAEWIDPVTDLSIGSLAQAVQNSPGSLLLIAEESQSTKRWMEAAARLAVASVVPCDRVPTSKSRWISMASIGELTLGVPVMCRPKLTVFAVTPATTSAHGWEEHHSYWSERLNLVDPTLDAKHADNSLPICGPRYLLATDDTDWAIHELVSALEAMDCPVEAILA